MDLSPDTDLRLQVLTAEHKLGYHTASLTYCPRSSIAGSEWVNHRNQIETYTATLTRLADAPGYPSEEECSQAYGHGAQEAHRERRECHWGSAITRPM